MRDKLIHQYFGVDYLTVWETAKYEIPEIKKEFEKIIKDLEGENENSIWNKKRYKVKLLMVICKWNSLTEKKKSKKYYQS